MFTVNVSSIAKEVGFKVPVAVTKRLWAGYLKPNPKSKNFSQTAESRLWAILSILRYSYQTIKDKKEIIFNVNYFLTPNQACQMWLKAVINYDDTKKPVITIMLTNEA